MDALMVVVVVLLLGGITAFVAPKLPAVVQRWVWFGFAEYMISTIAQLVISTVVYRGGDSLLYQSTGVWLASLLERNFSLTAPELLLMLFQRGSVLDDSLYGGGATNTGSMHAVSGWLIYILQGSPYAACALVAGGAFFGAIGIFVAVKDAYPEGSTPGLFGAIVLFPSIAFWTSALHKESFAIMGLGLVLLGWRSVYKRQWSRFLMTAPLGLLLLYLFRAPALPPLMLGLLAFFVLERVQRLKGTEVAVIGPAYTLGLFALVIVGMVALSRLVPSLGVAQLGATMSHQQANWVALEGDSTFRTSEGAPDTLTGQLLQLPLGLVNAMFRPQLFDVNNVNALVSAIEMTFITLVIARILMQNGITRVFARVQRSPMLLMSAIIAVIGCAFVGLVTFNFGSLVRYRVPFLPFYGVLLSALSQPDVARVKQVVATKRNPRELILAKALRRRDEQRKAAG